MFFLENNFHTEGKTMVVDRKKPEPLALLGLPSRSPPNVANSSNISLDAVRVRARSDLDLLLSSDYVNSSNWLVPIFLLLELWLTLWLATFRFT